MTCPATSSGCNGPHEGECMGLCTHRVNRPVQRMNVEFAGSEPEPEKKPQIKDSPITCALCAYRTHRPAGRLVAVRQAFKAWRMK